MTVPTTETVRERFADGFPREGYMQALEDFDRWFASEIDKAERRGAVKAGRAILEQQIKDMDTEFGAHL